jgi:hypothetical protein
MSDRQKASREKVGGLGSYLAGFKFIRNLAPESLKKLVRSFSSLESYRRQIWADNNPYGEYDLKSSYDSDLNVRLGIVKEYTYQHRHYVAACNDLKVPYAVVDISEPDWIELVRKSECDGFLVWPSAYITVWRQMYDERLKIIYDELHKPIYPNYDEIWFYESKRRTFYWLKTNGFACPETWIFYDRLEACEFARTVTLPVVFKTDLGAVASGVKIFRNRRSLLKCLKRCFKKGIVRDDGDPRDRQWGVALFQEFLPDVREWRIIRVGDSYFGYEKLKVDDFHSGSHAWRHGVPPEQLLDLVRLITDKHGFSSMDFDIFLTRDDRCFINEMQALFGMGNPYEMCVVDGKPGRMVYRIRSHKWEFEAGSYCQNYLCNLRVLDFLNKLGHRVKMPLGSNRRNDG